VPKAAINENRQALPNETKVWTSGEVRDVTFPAPEALAHKEGRNAHFS